MNPRIDLDFASRGPHRRHQGFVLVAGLGLLTAALLAHGERAGVLADAESALGRFTRRTERVRPPPQPSFPAARLKTIERELLRPWQAMFQSLESARHPKIQMMSIEPDGRTGLVTISGQSAGFSELTEYLERLRESALYDVLLQSHQQMTELPGRPVRFSIVARWDAPLVAGTTAAGAAR